MDSENGIAYCNFQNTFNFKVIVFESQYGGTDLLNKYIKGEDVSVIQAIYNIGFYHLMNNDILNFVKWLKEFNKNKKQDEQVMVYGCDSQSSRYVIDDLIKFLDDHQSLSKELKDRLIDLKDKMHETPKKVLHQTLNLLESSLKPLNVNDEIRQRQQIVIQSVNLATSSVLGGILKRDNYMAQNCNWLFNANHQSKMTIYAHNMHIAKAWDNSMKILMGQHILQLYPDYFVIGTGFNHGKVGLTGSTIVERSYKEAIYGSYDFVLSQCKYASYYLDFNLIDGEALEAFVGTKNLSRNTGANQPVDNSANVNLNYRKHVLSKSYDALLYFKESTPSQIMPAFKIP